MTVRVLIVDDHEPVRRGIRSLLTRRQDWSVCGEASDGIEAVEMARQLRPDVILMDLSMPRMNGAEATRIIREQVPEAEVIIVSQYDPELIRRQVPDIRARGYVSKATLARDLLPAILRIIGHKETEEGAGARHAETRLDEQTWLRGGGDLGDLIRRRDWSKTPLGALPGWPQSLRTAVNLMLNAQHPMWIGWGPEMIFLYNDAYISVLSLAKHPGALGRPAREVWAEIWDVCGPLADRVFAEAQPSFVNDVRLFMSRGEYLEETYYSFSYSPIYEESGKVGGLFCPSTETTSTVLHARRLRTLSEISAKALTERSVDAACSSCIAAIAENPSDIPFSMLYLLDHRRDVATLEGASHVRKGIPGLSPLEMALSGGTPGDRSWAIDELTGESEPRLCSLGNSDALPLGPAGVRVSEALVLPVTAPGQARPIAVLIAGINPTRKLDAEYSAFFSLISDQVAAAIQNATAVEEAHSRADELAEIDRAKTVASERERELHAKAELERSRLHDLLMQAPAVIALLTGPQHRFTYVNHECLHLSGRKRVEDLVGRPVREAMPELEAQGFVKLLDQVYAAGKPRTGNEIPALLERADGQAPQKLFFDFVFQPIKAVSGEVEGILVHAVEVTEQVNVRRAVQRSEERLRLAQEAANVGTWEWDPLGNTQALSPELHKIFGLEAGDGNQAETWAARVYREDWPKVQRSMEEGNLSGEMDLQYRYLHPSLGLRWFHCKGRRLREESRMFGVLLDITAAKHAELERGSAGRATALLAAIVDSSDDAIVSKNLDGFITSWNRGAERLFGYAAEEAVGQHITLIIPLDRRAEEIEILARIRRGEPTDHFETVRRRKDGSLIDVSATISPVRDADGRVIGASKVARDISEQKRSKDALFQSEARFRAISEKLDSQVRERTRELEERNAEVLRQSEQLRELSWRLLNMQDEERRHIARELHDSAGQTLAVLSMNLSALVENAKRDPSATARAAAEAQQLVLQITKDIRTMSYLLHPPLLDENGLPSALSWFIGGLTDRTELDIAFNISQDFGRLPREMELAIFRLVQECLTNIHRHSGSKSASIHVAREADRVLIEISDQGGGMSPEKLAEIQSRGAGLGIRGIRERLRYFHGEMIIGSSPSGTTVLVTIPVSNEMRDVEGRDAQALDSVS